TAGNYLPKIAGFLFASFTPPPPRGGEYGIGNACYPGFTPWADLCRSFNKIGYTQQKRSKLRFCFRLHDFSEL
ncbi:MAG: hypothetical protein MJ001_02310, partial [Paludibacteraceae bacterium]|nr:hypothetical protein [Paludibacteraceae bacterium]